MIKKWHWYIGFFVLLFGAYFIYFFSQDDFEQSSLPVINNNIQPFSFTNQNGKAITDRDIEGKVYVTEYFFTTCKGICPKMNANMRRVYDTYKGDSSFMIISHTCMPETDSVPLLKKYEHKMIGGKLTKAEDGSYKIDYDSTLNNKSPFTNNSWNFVTGDKTALYKMARQSYLIDNNKSDDTTANISDQFIHTQFFALVDKKSRVRGIYDGLQEEDIQKLLQDIKSVLKEKYQSRSLN
ncbi:MAG: SCO family protein [Ferruginibacter sp.]